jgi:surface antigen
LQCGENFFSGLAQKYITKRSASVLKKTTVALMVAAFALCAPSVSLSASAKKPQVVKTSKAKPAKKPVARPYQVAAATPSAPVAYQSAAAPQSAYLQCVGYARQATGMQIYGNAWTWWAGADGKYDRGNAPRAGAVMVFRSQGKMRHGHVAVVSNIITERYIQISHANWSPINGRRGQVEENVNVMDVSPNNDWSQVKVWYGPLNDFGTTVYTTYGFIYNDEAGPRPYTPSPEFAQNVQVTQAVAVVDELPSDVAAALTPNTNQGRTRAVQVTAQAKGGKSVVAQIDADNMAAAAERPVVAGAK